MKLEIKCDISGGSIKDLPEPHIRKFDDKRLKRKLIVNITVYYSLGRHYYVSVREEFNSIYDAKEKGGRDCWDDEIGKGKNFYIPKFDNRLEMEKYLRRLKRWVFPKHKFEYNTCGNITKKWFYRDGD